MLRSIVQAFGFKIGEEEDRRGVDEFNIALIGESGVGKSSFVNAIRG